jgi:hypothetical protein
MYEDVISVQRTVTSITQVKLLPFLLKTRIQSLSCMALGRYTSLLCVIIQMNKSQESFLRLARTISGADTASYATGIRVPSRGVNRPEREVDHSPASSTRQAMYVYA